MKGKACSLRDLRRIRHILANAERLKGEAEALLRCADKSTVSTWRKAIQVLDAVDLSQPEHIQPTHLREIARHAGEDEWPGWVKRCEKDRLTVADLRSLLMARQTSAAAESAETTAPTGTYRTLVIDPPWAYQNNSGRQRQPYAGRNLSLEEIKGFNVGRWVPPDDGHLYLWVTDAYAGDAYSIIRAWGFEPKCSLVWVKDRIGMGNYFRHQHELCFFAVKGNLRLKRMDTPTVFAAPMTKHSEKPDAFYSLVEDCSPGPYLDVFARKKRAGWDVFGDEVTEEYQLRIDGKNESSLVG